MDKKKIGLIVIILFLFIGLGSFVFANPNEEENLKKGDNVEKVDKVKDKDEEEKDADEEQTLNTVDEDDSDNTVNTNNNNTNTNNNNNNNDGGTGMTGGPDENYDLALEAVKKAETSFTQDDVDTAKELVEQVTNEDDKKELSDRLDAVQKAIDAEKLVAELENKVKNSKNLADMNSARDYRTEEKIEEIVSKLKDSSLKEELEKRLETVAKILDDNNSPVITGIDNNSYTKDDVTLTIEDENEVTTKVTLNGKEVEFTGKFTKEGTYVVTVVDKAFNETTLTFTIDKTAATIDFSTLDFSKSNVNFEELNGMKIYYVKNEDAFVFRIKFNEKLLENPILKVGKKEVELKAVENLVAKGEYVYESLIKITTENKLSDGFIELFVTNIKDLAGNETTDEKLTNHTETTNHRKVILDNTKPSIIVKDNFVGTIDEKIFSNVSFQLKDQYKIDKVKINGLEHKFTPNTVGDLNFDLGKNYYVEGQNLVILFDLAGNEIKYTFTLDTTAPKVVKASVSGGKLDKKNNNTWYVKEDKIIYLNAYFKEELAVKPIFTINDKVKVEATTVKYNEKDKTWNYAAVYKVSANDGLVDGLIDVKVSGYKDIAGNPGSDDLNDDSIWIGGQKNVVIDRTIPNFVVKDGYIGDIDKKIYSYVSFQLRDNFAVASVNVNGKEYSRKPNQYSDLNFQDANYVEGKNKVILKDFAGNQNVYEFVLDTTAPRVVKASVSGGNLDKKNNNTWYVKEDKIIYLNAYFKEELAVKPIFTINDKVKVEATTVKYNEKDKTWNYAAVYKVSANDGLVDGLIDVKVSGYKDIAGNPGSDDLNDDSIWIGGQKNVVIDKTNPERRVLGIALNGNIDSINAKNGDSIRIWVYFDEELRTLPKVKLGEKEYVMYHAPESNKYAYHLDVTLSDEMKLPQGKIDFKIYGYTDKAGNTNKELTKKDITYNPDKRNGKLVYDSIAPTFNFTNGKMYNYDFEVVVNDSMLAGMDVYNYSTGETIKLTGASNNKWKMTGETEHNMYKITAYDWAGNTSNIWIYKDTVKPVISGTGKTADSIVDIVNNGTYKSVDLKISDKNLSEVYVNDELVQSYEWDKVGDYEHIFDKHGKYVVKAVDRGENIETIEFNIDTEGPTVDTLRVKGLRPNKGTENFKYVKVGDTFQVILTTVEELKTLPTLYVDNQTVTNVVSKKFDNYYQYIMSYTILQDTTLVEGEAIKFKLSGYADALNNYGKDLTNDDIKIGNGQTSVTFDKTKPKITIDRDITLKVGDKFIDDIGEHVEDNITPLDNLYIGGGWGTFKDTTQPGDYYLNYKVMDEAGNYEVATRKIHVVA